MIRNEPVLTSSLLIGLVTAFLVMCQSMGWIALTEQQMTAVLGFVSAVVVVAGIIVRQYVAPWPLREELRKRVINGYDK